jgi:hypothetical protein
VGVAYAKNLEYWSVEDWSIVVLEYWSNGRDKT